MLGCIGKSDSMGQAMINYIGGASVRGDGLGFRNSGEGLSPFMMAVFFLLAAALFYLRVRWGTPIGMTEASSLYVP